MKKIMFNTKLGLEQAVLDGRKTQTRRIVPKEFIPILVERDDFTFSVNMVGGNMTSCPLHWVHWAYVIDLLPERKEETE